MPTLLFKPMGQTYALQCSVSTSTPVAITEQATCVGLLNLSNTAAAISFMPISTSGAAPAMVFPRNGTPSAIVSVVLPPNMTVPLMSACPAGGMDCYGISISTGNPVIYITPCEIMS